MANGPLHKLCHSCPWGHILYVAMANGPLMVLYINCANHVPGVKFGHAPGVDSLHRPTIGKTKKNLLL